MPLRDVVDFPQPGNDGLKFIGKRFVDERFDNQKFTGLVFEFCTLEKLGLRNSTFERCEFKHCEFIDCYFIGGTYDQCNFVGSSFDRCNFTWAKYPNSKLDYVNSGVALPYYSRSESKDQLIPKLLQSFFVILQSNIKVLATGKRWIASSVRVTGKGKGISVRLLSVKMISTRSSTEALSVLTIFSGSAYRE